MQEGVEVQADEEELVGEAEYEEGALRFPSATVQGKVGCRAYRVIVVVPEDTGHIGSDGPIVSSACSTMLTAVEL